MREGLELLVFTRGDIPRNIVSQAIASALFASLLKNVNTYLILMDSRITNEVLSQIHSEQLH